MDKFIPIKIIDDCKNICWDSFDPDPFYDWPFNGELQSKTINIDTIKQVYGVQIAYRDSSKEKIKKECYTTTKKGWFRSERKKGEIEVYPVTISDAVVIETIYHDHYIVTCESFNESGIVYSEDNSGRYLVLDKLYDSRELT